MSRKRGAWLFLVVLLALAPVACDLPDAAPPVEGELQVTFIDVGQGDAALVIGPSGRSLLLDTGLGQAYGAVDRALKKAGIDQPDAILISHPDQDHMGAAPGILINKGTQAFYMNLEDRDSRLYAATLREVLNLGLTPQPLIAGQDMTWEDGVRIQVLGPLDMTQPDANNRSAVLKISFGSHAFLFTGDIEKEAEAALIERYGRHLQATVVKIPHHGSDTSSSQAFINRVRPAIGVLSYGEDNSYGHPHSSVVARWQAAGAELYATPLQGTMTFYSDGQDLWLSAEKSLAPVSRDGKNQVAA